MGGGQTAGAFFVRPPEGPDKVEESLTVLQREVGQIVAEMDMGQHVVDGPVLELGRAAPVGFFQAVEQRKEDIALHAKIERLV